MFLSVFSKYTSTELCPTFSGSFRKFWKNYFYEEGQVNFKTLKVVENDLKVHSSGHLEIIFHLCDNNIVLLEI